MKYEDVFGQLDIDYQIACCLDMKLLIVSNNKYKKIKCKLEAF